MRRSLFFIVQSSMKWFLIRIKLPSWLVLLHFFLRIIFIRIIARWTKILILKTSLIPHEIRLIIFLGFLRIGRSLFFISLKIEIFLKILNILFSRRRLLFLIVIFLLFELVVILLLLSLERNWVHHFIRWHLMLALEIEIAFLHLMVGICLIELFLTSVLLFLESSLILLPSLKLGPILVLMKIVLRRILFERRVLFIRIALIIILHSLKLIYKRLHLALKHHLNLLLAKTLL